MTDRIAIIADTRPIDPQIIASHMRLLPGWDIRIITDFEPSISGYNRLLTSKELWESLPEHVLVFQQDSELFDYIPDWMLEYDYIGAPWSFQLHGGNGGLSLRRTSAMLKVINNVPCSAINEDVYFCNALSECIDCNLAPRSVCEQFSVETIFRLNTIGAHAIDKYLTEKECKQIRTQYDWRL